MNANGMQWVLIAISRYERHYPSTKYRLKLVGDHPRNKLHLHVISPSDLTILWKKNCIGQPITRPPNHHLADFDHLMQCVSQLCYKYSESQRTIIN